MSGISEMKRLLLVEDSVRLQALLGESLRSAGYPIDVVGTLAEARAAIAEVAYDLLIIDLGLPDGNGMALIHESRAGGHATPVLVITARTGIDDRIAGLDSGADDFLVKPFSHLEMLARIRAILRRPRNMRDPVLQVGRLVLNEATSEVRADGEMLDLRAGERRLLSLLMRQAGRIVPKSSIEERFYELGREVTVNAVEAHVSRLRKALEEKAAGVFIETVRGIGYALKESSK
jgi:two-component system, OmpR family, response regulator